MSTILKIEIASAQAAVDPFSLAANYSMSFVEFHPFKDGNGRMCAAKSQMQLFFFFIFFQYIGVFAPIAETEGGNKNRASADMEGHGEYATFCVGEKGLSFCRRWTRTFRGRVGRKIKCHCILCGTDVLFD